MRQVLLVAAIATTASGCVTDDLVSCGELTCPYGIECVEGACVTPADHAACEGLAEGAPCATEPDGFCHADACRASRCGDTFISPDEVCDDGNTAPNDGCAADCRSTELCGNGYVDVARGEQCDDGAAGLSGDGCSSTCQLEHGTWTAVTPQPLGPRDHHAMAYDPARARIVEFGGTSSTGGIVGDTWELVEQSWTPRFPPVHPAPRELHAMSAAPHGVLVFGGATASLTFGDTWIWDGVAWTEKTPPVSPPARSFAALAYDSTRHRSILFGGVDAEGNDLGDTWSWDGATWTELQPTTPPPARSGHALAYDPKRDRVVLFGGDVDDGMWELDGDAWVAIASSTPQTRSRPTLVYDEVREATFLVGGSSRFEDTSIPYVWDGATWTQLAASPMTPGARVGMAGAYDSAHGRMVIHGGDRTTQFGQSPFIFGDTWTYTTDWNSPALDQPGARGSGAMVADTRRGLVVLFGGEHDVGIQVIGYRDTWEWDGRTWIDRTASVGQSPTGFAAYDSVRGAVLEVDLATHTYDGKEWKQVSPTAPGSDTNDLCAGLAFDDARARGVCVTTSGATWEWDGATWSALDFAASASPPAGDQIQLVYDASRGVVVRLAADTPDAWEYDGAWHAVTPATPLPPRTELGATYDATRRRIVVFGGLADGSLLADAWEYDGATWTLRPATSPPPPRRSPRVAYAAARGEVLVFSGAEITPTSALPDTWALTSEVSPDSRDRCDGVTDVDGDHLVGCADPDCWPRCTPLCPPGAVCDPAATPHCGDGTCASIEDYLLCPADCTPP